MMNEVLVVSLPVAIATSVSIIISELLRTEVQLEAIMKRDTPVPYPPSKPHRSAFIQQRSTTSEITHALQSCTSWQPEKN